MSVRQVRFSQSACLSPKDETGSTILDKQTSKLEYREANSSALPSSARIRLWIINLRVSRLAFRIPNFKSRIPSSVFRFPFLLILIIAVNACNRITPPKPRSESSHPELASRFRAAVKGAGGTGVWIKHSGRLRHGQSSEFALQVLATPAAYRTVLAAVQHECDRNHLDLGSTASNTPGDLRSVTLKVMQPSGAHVLQIHVREVPRLLRAAIVIDDVGNEIEPARKLAALAYPLAFSVLPHLRFSEDSAREAHRSGHEVMLHLPMEPEPNAHISPGKGAVLVGMNAAEVRTVVEDDLEAVPYVAGVNNHMGSRVTQDSSLMAEVMKTLAGRHVYFIDSRTTSASVALNAARREHLPAFYRSVFLDDTETVPYTLGQLREFRQTVEREGVALAIGHPHATTIAALEEFLPEFERSDIELVAPSQIVRLPEIANMHPATVIARK
jgi:polysaccharide deacetylase 2 family uncharacterized protein YibQ